VTPEWAKIAKKGQRCETAFFTICPHDFLQACVRMVLRCGGRAHIDLDCIRVLLQLFAAVAVRDDGRHVDRHFLVGSNPSAHGLSPDQDDTAQAGRVIRAIERARNDLVHLEAKPDEQIERLDEEFEQLQE
jgi:hypothetical protein